MSSNMKLPESHRFKSSNRLKNKREQESIAVEVKNDFEEEISDPLSEFVTNRVN